MKAKPRTRGERVCAFIEQFCRVPEGRLLGQPMRLLPFQRNYIMRVYDNPHGTRRGYLSIGRKNGKTGLTAALLLAHIVGPEAIQNTYIASGAMSREQAAIVFELACKMINLEPQLKARARIVPSGKRIIGLSKNVEYRAMSAEGKTAMGHSPILVILDEVGQVRGPRSDFIDALMTAQGAHDHPLTLAISTQSPNDADLFSIWLDDAKQSKDKRIVSLVLEAPKDADLLDPDTWRAANPALGVFRSYEDVKEQAERAVRMPSSEATFRNLVLNQRVEAAAPFVSRTVWKENAAAPLPLEHKKVWAGLDLSSVSDLTALVCVTEDNDVHPTFWLPDEGLKEKSRADRVPYELWKEQGYLRTTPGRSIEYEYIAEHLRGLFDRCAVQAIAFDRYNMKFLRPWLQKANFSVAELEKFKEFGQGFVSMSPALRELESRLLAKKLKHGAHPVLTMCAENANVLTDPAGNRKFNKAKAKHRIDGMVALAMAIGVIPETTRETFQIFTT